MVLLVLAISACRNGAYNVAAKADTPEAWRQFLAANPKDDNVEAARARLAALEFEQAKAVHSLVAYKRFVEEFPQADDAPKALALLEALRFNAVSEAAGPQAKGSASDRASAWRNFLRDHPAGAHHEEAEKQLALLELVDLANLNDAATLARVAAEHPDDPRSLDAASKLDGLDWANAVTAAKLYAYLRQHPDGAHRDEAKVKLLSLQVDGLLVSGLLDQAQAEVKKNPLSPKLPDFGARLAKARVQQQLEVAKDERIRRALPAYHVRAFDDVVRSLHSPDPMDRWEAAEELGFHVSVKAIDPLLDMVRGARSVLVRQRAFESLGSVLRSLPHDVAEYEVATRLETLRAQAADTQLYLSMAALLDLSGQLELASFEYQRAYEPNAPEPVILRRWAQLRRERRQFFSAAVAAAAIVGVGRRPGSEHRPGRRAQRAHRGPPPVRGSRRRPIRRGRHRRGESEQNRVRRRGRSVLASCPRGQPVGCRQAARRRTRVAHRPTQRGQVRRPPSSRPPRRVNPSAARTGRRLEKAPDERNGFAFRGAQRA